MLFRAGAAQGPYAAAATTAPGGHQGGTDGPTGSGCGGRASSEPATQCCCIAFSRAMLLQPPSHGAPPLPRPTLTRRRCCFRSRAHTHCAASGHTSLSAAGLGFLTYWLLGQTRAYTGNGHAWRLVLALLPSFGAVAVGITRIDDYWCGGRGGGMVSSGGGGEQQAALTTTGEGGGWGVWRWRHGVEGEGGGGAAGCRCFNVFGKGGGLTPPRLQHTAQHTERRQCHPRRTLFPTLPLLPVTPCAPPSPFPPPPLPAGTTGRTWSLA